jgi:hypothetical protein
MIIVSKFISAKSSLSNVFTHGLGRKEHVRAVMTYDLNAIAFLIPPKRETIEIVAQIKMFLKKY